MENTILRIGLKVDIFEEHDFDKEVTNTWQTNAYLAPLLKDPSYQNMKIFC